uniref:Uncharacterized protein n=1 Tax=Alexandrium monilatum TaxID=311494 RepID=A0A7S4RQA7_9DINO
MVRPPTQAQLRAAGKRVVILSNYAGRAEVQRRRLRGIGIDPYHVDGVVTSGEIAHRYLSRYQDKLGCRVLWIAWPKLEQRGLSDYFSELEDYKLVKDVAEADFLLVSGVGTLYAGTDAAKGMRFEKDGDPVPFEPMFRAAIHASKPMVCANPDHKVVRPGGWRAHLPGALAEHFERLGGRVIYFGKPYTSAFEEVRRIFDDLSAGGRICHIGDSLHHDVGGATTAGFDAAFVVRTGIHAKDLPKEPNFEDIFQLCRKQKTPVPAAVVPRFTW